MTRRGILGALALVAAPALAAALDGSVTIYGTVSPFFDSLRASGATAPGLSPASGGATQVPAEAYTGTSIPPRFRLTSGTSNLGFKGGLDLLGEDLQVFFQVESALSADGDPPSSWNGRNTGAGLQGKFGRLLFGLWDTPYKFPTPMLGAVRSLNPFDNALVGNPGFGVPATTTQTSRNGKADAAFSRRQGNSVQYWSPDVHGFSARVGYSANEGKTSETATARSVAPALYSGVVSYAHGPLTLRYGYERHDDYFGLAQLGGSAGATLTNRSSHDDANEVVAWYTLPTNTKLSAIAERLAYHSHDTTAGAIDDYRRDALYLLVQQRVGPHQLWGSLGLAGAGTAQAVSGAPTTNGLDGRQWSVGYSYALSKNADLFGAYYEMNNGRSASYAVFPSPGTIAPGATTRGFGVGLLYTFLASWNASL